MTASAAAEPDLKDSLALALDTDDLSAATRLARSLVDRFRVAKVGLELYSAVGPRAVETVAGLGYDVFCDLKLHDIPTTVRRAARAVARLGAAYITVHAAGGPEMLRAAADGFAQGAGGSAVGSAGAAGSAGDPGSPRGIPELAASGVRVLGGSAGDPGPRGILAVTVLTSERHAPKGLLTERVEAAEAAGCAGIVCAAPDLDDVAGTAGELLRVVPGMRLPGDSADDQRRVATPAEALAAGADLLVIGRAVTAAPDPVAASRRLHEHLRLA